MAMTAGTVSVGTDGTVTKSGMAEAIYDQLVSRYEADNDAIPSGADGVPYKQSFASLAEPIAAGVVAHIEANAEVVIDTATGALQTSTGSGNPTDPPATDQSLAVR